MLNRAVSVLVLSGCFMAAVLAVACDSGAARAVVVADAGMVADRPPIPPLVPWNRINRQTPDWYAGASAAYIADNVLYYQNANGGWPKDIDMTQRLVPRDSSTIDNSATTTQLIFLAKVYNATTTATYHDAFIRGLDYLLMAQYPNGGWPQDFPNPREYHKHITFNDGAMTHVIALLKDIGARSAAYAFVDEERATSAQGAMERGIACILQCQIVVEGQKTGWCAQHDEVTLAPAGARAYELPSESGQEGAGVLEFLMAMDNPSPDVVDAVQAAVRWFNQVQLRGIRVTQVNDTTQPSGRDVVVVEDAAATAPIWARFYEIGTNRPFFSGRDGIKKYSLAEIENERRVGYSWYSDEPADVLASYGAWQLKWAPGNNVLTMP